MYSVFAGKHRQTKCSLYYLFGVFVGRYSNCAELNPVQEYTNRITISIGYSKSEETENPNMFCSVVRR